MNKMQLWVANQGGDYDMTSEYIRDAIEQGAVVSAEIDDYSTDCGVILIGTDAQIGESVESIRTYLRHDEYGEDKRAVELSVTPVVDDDDAPEMGPEDFARGVIRHNVAGK